MEGYFLNESSKDCKKCMIKNCLKCSTDLICHYCKESFYFNEESKKCESCKNNCLECSSDGEECYSCPIDYFSLEKNVITKLDNVKYFSDLG